MAAQSLESSNDPIRDVITRLQSPMPDLSTLLSLLCSILDELKLLPSHYKKYASGIVPHDALKICRHIPPLQRALLEHIIPTWEPTLADEGKITLLDQFFCPEPNNEASGSNTSAEIALLAYSNLLSLPLTGFSMRMLKSLCDPHHYPVDRLYNYVLSSSNSDSLEKKLIVWEDCVRNIVAVPAKVANMAGKGTAIPSALEQGIYFNNVCQRCEIIIFDLSHNPISRGKLPFEMLGSC